MRIGNVIRPPDSRDLWIVTSVSDRLVSAVSFDSENCTATQRLEDSTQHRDCECMNLMDGGGPDTACERCHGSGAVTVIVKGWKHAKVIAPSAQAFLLDGVKKLWGLR
jgi:hypothetical protein